MNSHNNQQGFATIIVVIAIAVLAVGGGTVAYFMTDGFGMNASEATVTEEVNSMKEKAQDTSGVEDGQVPDGFPADMPIYPGATIITGSKDEEDGGYRLGLNTKDSEAEVIKYYKTELKKAGWNPSESNALSGLLNVSNDAWIGSVTIVESTTTDSGTTISYMLDKK